MAETLRDMVVSLSLNSDNFSANLRSINQQLKEADSQFKLAASGVTNFENTAAGAQAQLASLQQKFQLQQQAVQQYERALEAAKGKLETSVQTHEKLAAKLDTARQRHADLGQQVDKLTADLREAEEAGLKGTDAYAEMEAELERLKSEYAASGQEVQKLEGQLSRSENAMRRNADAVTKANTNLNNARAGLAKAAGKSVEGVGKSLSKLSAVAIGAGTVAVKTFASYDDAIRQVYATMGLSESESTAEMKALSDAAQEMGASTRYSASEAASALNYLALAGYDSEKAIEALPTVLNLAQASGIDLASASDMVTDSMSALGLEMSYMPAFADQMAQLGEGMRRVWAWNRITRRRRSCLHPSQRRKTNPPQASSTPDMNLPGYMNRAWVWNRIWTGRLTCMRKRKKTAAKMLWPRWSALGNRSFNQTTRLETEHRGLKSATP